MLTGLVLADREALQLRYLRPVHHLRACKCLRVLPGSLHCPKEFLETVQAAARRAGAFPLLGTLPLILVLLGTSLQSLAVLWERAESAFHKYF